MSLFTPNEELLFLLLLLKKMYAAAAHYSHAYNDNKKPAAICQLRSSENES